ncbi:glycosyltransferase family 4 protein [Synechococcus sp. CS-1332]|nr:glycosyltransferase family 4 protein [Synechococcus sp. CS-1332]
MTSHRFAPDVGGIEIQSELLARNFTEMGHQVLVVTQTPLSSSKSIDSFPFAVERLPSFLKLATLYRWADVVLQVNIELRTLWPALCFHKPFVISTCTWISDANGKMRTVDRLKRFILRRATASIAISEAIRSESCSSSVVVGNPFRSDQFQYLHDLNRTRALVFVGRLVSDKGVDLLLKAFSILFSDTSLLSHVKSSGCELALTLIGDGPELSSLTRLAMELGIGDNVCFAGSLLGEDLVRCLNQHCVMAVPSRWAEPFGIVALEGAACGCIVVGSDGGGLPDAIGEGGFLFKSGCVQDLAATLRNVLTLPIEEVSRLRELSAAHLQQHTEHQVAASYLSVLEKAVSLYPSKDTSFGAIH